MAKKKVFEHKKQEIKKVGGSLKKFENDQKYLYFL